MSPNHTPHGRQKRATTIGVHNWSLETWLSALQSQDVSLVVDVRQRRGVRGREYSWANSKRLQATLASAGLDYVHHRELAPTTELRQIQYREDARLGVGKRDRISLAPEYRARYLREILDPADLEPLVATLPNVGSATLLCVESAPEACHRSNYRRSPNRSIRHPGNPSSPERVW